MKAPNARSLSLSTLGLALTAAAAAYSALGAAPANSHAAALRDPIPGLSCGWDGNPCKLEALVVTASAKG